MSGSHQHPYHLVEPSPWPAVGSAAAFITAIGGIMFMHERAYGEHVLAVGLGLVLLTMFMWCCLLYTSPSPRDRQKSRMPSSA